jgi:hypothetical protein
VSITNEERIAKLETMIRNGRECLALRRRPGMSPLLKEANERFEQMINNLEEELDQLRKAQRV